MAPINHKKVLNILAIVCAIWFLFTSWIWTYLINLVFSFPIGLLGLLCWYFGRNSDGNDPLNKLAIRLIMAGVIVSILSFALFYFRG